MTSPIAAVITGFRKYVVFDGRATRAEYWWWVLFISIGGIVFNAIDNIIGSLGENYGPFYALFFLATLLPGTALTARRLHDIGKTGWWQLGWYVIPAVAWLATGIMFLIAIAITFGTTDASGKWSFDSDNVPSEYVGEAFVAFLPAGVMLLAAWGITLAVIVWWIIWMARRGESGENRFGSDPRA